MQGIDCRFGQLADIDLRGRFDLILFRAVLYRTSDPTGTLSAAKRLLAPGGEISIIDPCVDLEGVRYFAFKQFPQGRYYITDFDTYAAMLLALLCHKFLRRDGVIIGAEQHGHRGSVRTRAAIRRRRMVAMEFGM